MEGSITLYIGCMYSGKTTALLRKLTIYSEMGLRCLYINSDLDTRSITEFSTHNPSITLKKDSKKIDMIKISNLHSILELSRLYDVIGIDEGQFFTDLKDFVLLMSEKYEKQVIISGLDGDFKRNSFGQILDLIPYCDNIEKLKAFCKPCFSRKRELKDALFSKRIVNSNSTILIGEKDEYVPVCRSCYSDENFFISRLERFIEA
jgi:thymidine kinase